jgi:hypothetical protein
VIHQTLVLSRIVAEFVKHLCRIVGIENGREVGGINLPKRRQLIERLTPLVAVGCFACGVRGFELLLKPLLIAQGLGRALDFVGVRHAFLNPYPPK